MKSKHGKWIIKEGADLGHLTGRDLYFEYTCPHSGQTFNTIKSFSECYYAYPTNYRQELVRIPVDETMNQELAYFETEADYMDWLEKQPKSRTVRIVKPRYRIYFGYQTMSRISRYVGIPLKDQLKSAYFICPVTKQSVMILPIEYCCP